MPIPRKRRPEARCTGARWPGPGSKPAPAPPLIVATLRLLPSSGLPTAFVTAPSDLMPRPVHAWRSPGSPSRTSGYSPKNPSRADSCFSARKLDTDRHHKVLISLDSEGQTAAPNNNPTQLSEVEGGPNATRRRTEKHRPSEWRTAFERFPSLRAWATCLRLRRAEAGSATELPLKIEAVQGHHLGPGVHKIFQERFLPVVGRVVLRDSAQLRV